MQTINPIYFYRDYNSDFPEPKTDPSLVLRIAKASTPFIGLYQPAGKLLAGSLGALRSATSLSKLMTAEDAHAAAWESFNTALALASLAGTLFAHPLGILLTTIHDLGIHSHRLYLAIAQGEGVEAAKQVGYLANHALYLTIMIYGSLELQIASLAMQVLVEGIASYEEIQKGNWIEAAAHILMAAVRGNQLNGKVETLRQKWALEEAIRNHYVGTLGSKWQFPSDHLPIGAVIDGKKVVSWNVLNNEYINWVTEEDSQGLNGSMISDLNQSTGVKGLTLRDQKVAEMIQAMIDGHADLVALQECGAPFLDYLESNLPDNWAVVRSFGSFRSDQDVILYNRDQFTYDPSRSETTLSAYPSVPKRPLQNALFEDLSGAAYRFINGHIPGDPSKPGTREFADYVSRFCNQDEVTIALGDMNFERHEMEAAYQHVGLCDYTLLSPWQTNIDPLTRMSKGIDHIFVKGTRSIETLVPNAIFGGNFHLEETIDLLRKDWGGEREAI